MSEMKILIDQYAAENAMLRQQIDYIGTLLKEIVFIHQDNKGEVRVPGKNKKIAEKYGLSIKQLKTSTILKVIEQKEE